MIREPGDRPWRSLPPSFGVRDGACRLARPFSTGTAGWPLLLSLLLHTALADSPDGATATVDVSAAPSGAGSATLTSVPLGPDEAGGSDLAGLLDHVPGATVRRLGGLGDFAAVRLRGSTFQQVELFLDGVPLNPNGDSVIDLSTLPVASFSEMLVYRGFSPARYGSAAMGGVIDLLTATHAPASLGISGGSWGTVHSFGAVQPCLGQTDVLLTFDQLHTNGDWPYFDDQGTEFNRFDDRTPLREHNRIDRASGVARIRTRAPAAGATVSLMDVPSWTSQELPGPISNPSADATWAGLRNLLVVDTEVRHQGRRRASGFVPGWRAQPRAWWLYRDEVLHDPLGELSPGEKWTRGVWNTGGASIEGVRLPARWLSVGLLARGRQDDFRPFDLLQSAGGQGVGDGERIRRALTAALSADAWVRPGLGTVTLSPVLQVDVLDSHQLGDVPFEASPVSPGTDDLEAYVLPRGAVAWAVAGPLTLRGSAGLYVRPPELTELFGDQGVVVGNTDLVAEHGFGVEVGAHVADTAVGPLTVGADAAYARQRVHDLITWVPNSQQTEHAVNLDEAYIRALEGALNLGLTGHLAGVIASIRSASSVTQLLARNLDTRATYSNNQLPNLPPWDVSQTTTLSMSTGWLDSLAVSHSWTYASGTFQDAANQVPTAPRNLHGLGLSVRPARGLPTLEASVLNLFDVRGAAIDRNPLDPDDNTLVVKPLTDFVGYPLPGRTVMVTVRWEEFTQD